MHDQNENIWEIFTLLKGSTYQQNVYNSIYLPMAYTIFCLELHHVWNHCYDQSTSTSTRARFTFDDD
eukprot:1151395-Amphidinium_carterae.1